MANHTDIRKSQVQKKVSLKDYDNTWYSTKGGTVKRTLWYFINVLFVLNPLNPFSSIKVWLLRLFGGQVGRGVVFKPGVNVKYPWLLRIGDHTWIGEGVWIDNLVKISIGSNCCLSQGAMLLTGNHDYKRSTFDLLVGEIVLEDGVWIGAKSIVGPGVTCGSHSVLAAGSVASRNLEAYSIYRGNPAAYVKERTLGD